jgi:hypothetical protein
MIALAIITGGRQLDRLGLVGRHRQVERPLAWRNIRGQISALDDDVPRPFVYRYRYPADLISYAGTGNLWSMELRETRSVDWRPATGMISRPSRPALRRLDYGRNGIWWHCLGWGGGGLIADLVDCVIRPAENRIQSLGKSTPGRNPLPLPFRRRATPSHLTEIRSHAAWEHPGAGTPTRPYPN